MQFSLNFNVKAEMWFFLWSKWCLEVFIYSFTCYSHLNPKTEQKYHESCVDAISFSTCYSNVIILWKIAADTQRWRQIYLHIWWSYPNNEKSVQMFCEDVNCLLSSIVKVRRWNRQRTPKRFVENDDYNRFVSYMFAESNCNIEGLYLLRGRMQTQLHSSMRVIVQLRITCECCPLNI